MDKVKLAICMKDLEYQARFVNCLMNHYKHLYEVHVFTSLEELKMTKPLEYSVIITGEYSTEEMTNFVEGGEKLLYLTEEIETEKDSIPEKIICTEKYQEVYKIAELIQRLTGDEIVSLRQHTETSDCKWVGIYSLSKEKYQIPVAVLLAEIFGEEEKVLLLDLQAHSGLMEKEEVYMGLEDLLSVATTGKYSRGRLLECIGHESNWDYIYPAKNTECLAEGSLELYKTLIEILEKELKYQRIIINFGAVFQGQMKMMELCDSLFLLSGKGVEGNWRETGFFHELHRREQKQLLQKITRIDVPISPSESDSWRRTLEKWRWGSFAENIRQISSKERKNGTSL